MKIKPLYIVLFLICHCPLALLAEKHNKDTVSKPVITGFFVDNPVAAMLDSLANSVLFKGRLIQADTASLNVFNYAPDEVPQFPDSIYKQRLERMRMESPFPYVYNQDVRAFINLYAQRRRQMTSRLLGLAEFYFPLFEEQLAKHNVPLELKYLAVIESALNPKAISRAGAAGLWQFMYRTGRSYGLEVTSYVDYRFDPYKATIAACEHFVDLYRVYRDWNLVLAAYNAGSGNVNRAIRRAGGERDYWKIRRFLPRETQNYVPIFIAASYTMMHAAEHNIFPVYPAYLFEKTDTITITQKISFAQISEALNISVETLEILNPSFKRNVIPSTADNHYKLKMPFDKAGEFLANEEDIYNFKTLDQLIKEDYLARNPSANIMADRTHRVRAGESLHVIANRYRVRVRDIQEWNNIRGTTIHPGQNLIVSVAPPELEPPKPPENTIVEIHITQPHESLRCIAQKYDCTVDNIRLWNELRDLRLTSGMELKIHIPIEVEEELAEEQTPVVDLDDNSLQKTEVASDALSGEELAVVPTNITSIDDSAENKDTAEKETSQETETETYIYYVVKSGDTLWDIVQKHEGVTVADIKRLNNLRGNTIRPGQRLRLPANPSS